MRDGIEKAISLGLGIIAAGKEQIEKAVEELVKKGEVSRTESKELVDDLVRKGGDLKRQMESMVQERVNSILKETRFATREDIERIERRLDALERKDRTEG